MSWRIRGICRPMTAKARGALYLAILGSLLGSRAVLAMTIEIEGGGVEYIKVGDSWLFFRGKTAPSDPASAWKEESFVPSGWETGPSGFGYGDNDDATVLSDMQNSYRTVYIRKEFTVSSFSPGDTVELTINYDDGFAAYLNGTKVANRHMPAEPWTYMTLASDHEAGTPEKIALGTAGSLLHVGTNLLAIEGHNVSLGSGDLSLAPALRTIPASDIVRDGDTWVLGTATAPLLVKTTAAGVASVKIGGNNATYDSGIGKWKGTAALVPGLNTVAVEAFDAGQSVVEQGTIKILYVPPSNRVSGTLAGSATWSGAVVAEDTVTVPAGAVLTVQAGTTVMFKSTASLIVNGQILADGTAAEPIRFTHYGDGTRWERIMLIQAADSRFRNCTFEYTDSVGDHQDYYVPGPRTYHEGFVALACHVDFEECTFQKMPDDSAAPEGDALAIMSDDQDHPGAASADFRKCQFRYIGQGIHTRFARVLVENCYFVGKHGDNDDVDLWGESDPPCVIRNCIFDLPEYDDRVNPTRCSAIIEGNFIAGGNDHGFVLRDKGSPIVRNNVIMNCAAGGIAVENSCTATLINNTIIGCGRGLRLFDLGRWDPPYSLNPGGGTATAINCIIWDCTESITLADSSNTTIPDKGSHITVIHCDIEGGRTGISVSGSQSTVTWGEGNIDADPKFVNPANRDLHLNAGSPAIDAGTADQAPATDRDGNPRPCGAGFDMGAYEHGCSVLPVPFRRGDPNLDEDSNISDAIFILLHLFGGGRNLTCEKGADVNDDGALGVEDAIYLLSYLFIDGPAPPPPFDQCGEDTKADELTCQSYAPCQ